MRDLVDLQHFRSEHRHEQLSLCTIVKKTGSSYRAVGAKKIVARSHGSGGLLSGGCLEADIDKKVRARWRELPFIDSFSTSEPEDRLLGYQAGCAGVIDVLFEALPDPASDIDLFLPFGDCHTSAGVCVSLDAASLGHRHYVSAAQECGEGCFFDRRVFPPRLSIIGCGPDSQIFREIATSLGWQVYYFDYRESFANQVSSAVCLPLVDLADAIPRGQNSAVVLMTHNFQADGEILAKLCGADLAYIGCLGPKDRYEQIRAELRFQRGIVIPSDWERCVHAPAGMIQKCRNPADIALTVIAQIQEVLIANGSLV